MMFTNWLKSLRSAGNTNRTQRRRQPGGAPPRFRPRLEAMEDRVTPSTMIDARALTMPALALDSASSFSTAAVFSANLAAGTHTILYNNGVAAQDIVAFSVDNSGAVDYDTSLNTVLSGRGTSTLVVNGVTVQIDAHALTVANLALNYAVNFATATPLTATLLPGAQSLLYVNDLVLSFSVNNSGAVDYNASLNGILSGRGTSTLVIGARNTTTAVTSSLGTSVFGQGVTFTATIAAVGPGTGTPTGTVTFKDGNTTLGTGTLDGSGRATITTAALSVGTHNITSVYTSNAASFLASTSPATRYRLLS